MRVNPLSDSPYFGAPRMHNGSFVHPAPSGVARRADSARRD